MIHILCVNWGKGLLDFTVDCRLVYIITDYAFEYLEILYLREKDKFHNSVDKAIINGKCRKCKIIGQIGLPCFHLLREERYEECLKSLKSC